MAKKNRGNGIDKKSEAPEGFNITAKRAQGDGWVSKEEGNIVHGRLLGSFTMEGDNEPRLVFQVELLAPCKGMKGSGDEAEEVEFEVGAVVNADGAALRGLEPYVKDGNVYEVWWKYIGKRKVGRGTMSDTDGPHLKLVKRGERQREDRVPF